jgi:hypothetical protein
VPTVYPIAWEPPLLTGRYRHLLRRDIEVWERWLTLLGSDFEAVAYDVAVGGATPAGDDISEADKQGWRYTTALKIDVVIQEADGVWAVEIKPAASVSAIGAALCYPWLLAREEPDLVVLGGGIVCAHLPPDIAAIAADFRVRVWVV